MSEILGNINIWVFLVKSESVLIISFLNICCIAILLKTAFFCTFWRLNILWRKIVQNLYIFVYLFCTKNSTTGSTNLHTSGMVGRIKLYGRSLNCIFNVLLIDLKSLVIWSIKNQDLRKYAWLALLADHEVSRKVL